MNMHSAEFDHCPIVPWIEFKDQTCWDDVLNLGRKITFKSKTVIQRPDNEVNSIFLLRSGMIKVAAASREGLQRTLWLMGPGSVLGEAAMFGHHPYMHHITAMEDCVGYEFSKKTVIEQLLPHFPAISVALLSNIASKCYIMSSQIEDSTFLSVPQRLGRFFYGLCLARNSRHLPLSHATIADLLGIHRVTVSNTVSALKRTGLLQDDTHEIIITDINALAAFLIEDRTQDL